MFTENDIVLNNTQNKLLFEIYKQLNTLNSNIQGLKEDLKSNNANIPFDEKPSLKLDYIGMKRPELMDLVKKLDVKPEGWTKYSNKELIKLLER